MENDAPYVMAAARERLGTTNVSWGVSCWRGSGLELGRGVHRRELVISSAIERTAVPLLVLPAPLLKEKGRIVLHAGRADLAYRSILSRRLPDVLSSVDRWLHVQDRTLQSIGKSSQLLMI